MKMQIHQTIYWWIWHKTTVALFHPQDSAKTIYFSISAPLICCGGSPLRVHNMCTIDKAIAFQQHFLDASSAYCMCTFLFYLSLLCLLCFLFFFPSPHAVPKRALQRDKYGSQTKHCLSNVIDFGFTFFSLDADKGLMKTKCHSLCR